MQVDGITPESSNATAQVSILNKERGQAEAVAAKLIQGVEETPTARSDAHPTGKSLNIPA